LTKNFLSIEVWLQNIWLGLGYITHNKVFRIHLFAMKMHNNVFHTYPHNQLENFR